MSLTGYRCPHCDRAFYVDGNEEAYVCPLCSRQNVWQLVGPFQLQAAEQRGATGMRDERGEDPRLAEITREVMRKINACTPGARLADVPTLFAFGPIYDALQAAEQRMSLRDDQTDRLRALIADLRGNAEYMADNPPESISTDSLLWRTTIDLQRRAAEALVGEAQGTSQAAEPQGAKGMSHRDEPEERTRKATEACGHWLAECFSRKSRSSRRHPRRRQSGRAPEGEQE